MTNRSKTGTWPASEIEWRDIDSLVVNDRNARTHSTSQIEQIAKSMDKWGWTIPCLIDEEDVIIAGHGRRAAAKLLGYKQAPCMVARGWSDAEKKAYALADNQLALNADWDQDLLRAELQELRDWDFDESVLGFENIDALLAQRTEGLTDPDAVPPVPAEPVTKVGDIYQLGNHRLMCGDATSQRAVEALLEREVPNLMVTDPPYGVEYDPAWRQRAGVGSPGAALGKVMNDDRADWAKAFSLFPGTVAYIWYGVLHAGSVEAAFAESKFDVRSQIIWVKTRPVLSRGHYHWQHETCAYVVREDEPDDHWRFIPEHECAAYAVKHGKPAGWQGGRRQSTVWFIEHLKSDTGHGTQKPVEAMSRPVRNNSEAGDLIYDPFVGSGTTLIACEMEGRFCYAMDLDPVWVDVAVRRWEDFTGRRAELLNREQTEVASG